MSIARLGVCLILFIVTACATAPEDQAVLAGTANVAEFVDLPPDAVFEATLEDVSRADVAATKIGSSHLDPAGSPPFQFKIAYDPGLIDPRHRYAVRARIVMDGRMIFTSDTVYPVLTRGGPDNVNLLLQRVPIGSKNSTRTATPSNLR